MQYKLITLYPKLKEIGVGSLSIGEKLKDAEFYSGNAEHGSQVLASMHRVSIDSASADGFMLSGFQPNGCEKNGTLKYVFQKWFLCYLNAGEKAAT
jgi:hypothetical protein